MKKYQISNKDRTNISDFSFPTGSNAAQHNPKWNQIFLLLLNSCSPF